MMHEMIAGTVRKSKRLNVVQSSAQYTNGDGANVEQSPPSCEPRLETHELENNEENVDHRDDNLDNMPGMILTKNDQHSKLTCII
jgi:hypothetical protein